MSKRPLSGRGQQNYRAAPRPSFIFATPIEPTKLVAQARVARSVAAPRQALAHNVGRALREFYSGVLREPLPKEFAVLMEGLDSAAAETQGNPGHPAQALARSALSASSRRAKDSPD